MNKCNHCDRPFTEEEMLIRKQLKSKNAKAGLAEAKLRGKHIGRPLSIDYSKIYLLEGVSKMADDLTFGKAVSEARKKIGLSQKQLAEKVIREDGEPISPQYLNDIEHDRRSPSSDHMVSQFADVLGLKADYLHYLNGRFPEPERKGKLSPQQFDKAIAAFRSMDIEGCK